MNNKKKTILIADDNHGIVKSLAMVLQYDGYAVDTIMNGEEVKKLTAPFPDLILLDIWMAGVNGLDLCKYLRAQQDTKHIPIIMISAYPDSDTKALEAGANDFIEKPYTMDDVLTKVGKYIEKKV
ncbi:MAG: response regulator [Candidatus Paceibacterota bacterium]